MFTVEEKTTFVGITDLRTQASHMLKHLKDSRVVLTSRNHPKAVILDYEDYQKMCDLIELAEEAEIASLVKKRKNKNKGHFISHQELLKKLSLKSI